MTTATATAPAGTTTYTLTVTTNGATIMRDVKYGVSGPFARHSGAATLADAAAWATERYEFDLDGEWVAFDYYDGTLGASVRLAKRA